MLLGVGASLRRGDYQGVSRRRDALRHGRAGSSRPACQPRSAEAGRRGTDRRGRRRGNSRARGIVPRRPRPGCRTRNRRRRPTRTGPAGGGNPLCGGQLGAKHPGGATPTTPKCRVLCDGTPRVCCRNAARRRPRKRRWHWCRRRMTRSRPRSARRVPRPRPTRPTPSSIHVATGTSNGAEPRTMKEAVLMALANMRRAS